MRDDIKRLFNSLNNCYQNKIRHYKILLNNCRECEFHINGGNFTPIEEMLEISDDTIETIDTIDFDIAQIKADVCKKCGIEYHDFERFFFIKNSFSLSNKTHHLVQTLKPLLRESILLRENLINEIQYEQSKLANSIDSLSRTRALNTRFHILQG